MRVAGVAAKRSLLREVGWVWHCPCGRYTAASRDLDYLRLICRRHAEGCTAAPV